MPSHDCRLLMLNGDCQLCALELRLEPPEIAELQRIATWVESIPQRLALQGEAQGQALDLASRIREFAIIVKT